eukprot:NODE_20656_length_788_cov_4.281392.p2 GENE.NODE_20656_length_788_cov_4.281392~~NODE_20656_length_788_cov_4.281392.p2  ORF type:complete len:140 (-),score=40.68 NODE_20656_length_788_cov_4.281392:345-764(-)
MAAAVPAQKTMDCPVDVEAPVPVQCQMEDDGVHALEPKLEYITTNDNMYSKCLCCICSLGEVLGEVVCGRASKCFCYKGSSACGLGGEKGCPAALGSCEMYYPTAECGMQSKCFCCQYGCVACWVEPKPFCVFNKKTIA